MTFLPYQLLTANDLNVGFNRKADLTTTGPQSFLGQVSAPLFSAGTAVYTVDLNVSGSAFFTSVGAMTVPVGSTLQRPLITNFGMMRANSTTGNYEMMLGNGKWGQITTTDAVTGSATTPFGLAGVTFGSATSNAIPVSWALPAVGTPPYLFTLNYRAAGTTNWISWIVDASDSTRSATVSGLLDATRYEFQLLARNTAASTSSPITSSSTQGFTVGGPTSLLASFPTSSTVTLNWDGVATSPVAYVVRYAPIGNNTWITFGAPTSDLFMTVSGLNPNQLYNFQVLARNTAGSFESNIVQQTTLSAAQLAPNAPTNLSFPATSISSVTMSWTAPNSGNAPFAYQIQYQVSGATDWTLYKTPVTSNLALISGLNSSTNYLFRVQAINSAGSALSANGLATTTTSLPGIGNVSEFQTSGAIFPVISGPILGSITANSALGQFGISVDDPPSAYLTGSMIVSVTCGSGNVTMTDVSNNPILGSGTNSIANFATTLSGAQAALGTLTYTASATGGSDSIRVTVTDQLTQTNNILISINVSSIPIPSPTPTPTPTPTPSPPPPTPPPGGNPGGGLRTSTGHPTDANGTLAVLGQTIANDTVICTHMEANHYNGGYSGVQAAVLENKINYIGYGGGLRFVRELCAGNMNQSWLAQISQNCGGFNYIFAGDAVSPFLYGSVENDIVFMTAIYFGVQGFEGFNPAGASSPSQAYQEQGFINNLALTYDKVSYQSAPVNENDAGTIQTFGQVAQVGTTRAYFGSCPNGPYGVANDVEGALHEKIGRGKQANPGTDVAVVEFGYQTFPDAAPAVSAFGFVSESVQAKYLIEGILDAFNLGSYYTAIYELIDNDKLYGLFHNDGTPKPAANALRYFFQLMRDQAFIAPGSVQPGKLNYTISGVVHQFSTFVNTGLQQALFQNSGGSFMLWLWNEQPLNDSATNANLSVANVPIVINFNESFMQQVQVYDIFNPSAVSSGNITPTQIFTNVSSIPISLPPYPILLLISHP